MRMVRSSAASVMPLTMFIVFALVCSLLVSTTFAQSVNGRIEGTVRDATEAVVPNASVIVTNPQTGAERNVTTSDEGVFAIPELTPGTYNVRVEATSFKTVNIPNVMVEVGTPSSLNVELQPGEVSEVVTIDASAAQEIVNTTNAEIGDVVDRRRVLDLPLDGRNPLDLIGLQAGADGETGRVNGNRARGLNITVNGINASDNFNKSEDTVINNPTIPVSVESVREFRVTTGLATAEYGRGSAQVNVISQSGTNRFSGSLFEFHRNTALNANNFFNNRQGLPRATLIRNQFGGRIGGPILIPKLYDGRDRTFFFFSYEGTRLAASDTVNRLVYTEQARAGTFRYLNGLATTPANVASNPNAIRTAPNLLTLRPGYNAADPSTAALIARTPLPNNFDNGDGLNTGGFRFNARRSAPKDIYSFRLDHRFSDKYSFELNYAYGNDFQLGDVVNSRLQLFPEEFGTDRLLRGRGFSTAFLASLTPALVNEFRFGFQNASTDFTNQSFGATPTLITLNTVTSPFYTNANNGRQTPVYQFIENLTYSRGAHLIKTGFDIRLLRGRRYSFAGTIPVVDLSITDNNPGLTNTNFPGISTAAANPANVNFANSLLNNLTGAIRRVSQTFNAADRDTGFVRDQPLRREYRTEEYDFYVQDTWKVRPNLSLNLGLRYEYSTVPHEVSSLIVLPVGGVFGPTAPENLFVPGGTLGARTVNDLVPEDFQFFKDDRNNFAPVVSFAYSPFKDSKTSIRAGYRVSYIRENFQLFENIVSINSGLALEASFNRSASTPTFLRNGTPAVATPTLNLPLSLQTLFQSNNNLEVAGFNENLRTPYVQEWMASLEREVFKDTVFEVRYIGNRGTKLIRVFDINEVNVFAHDSISGQTFLDAFLVAQRNLAISRNAGGTGSDNFAFRGLAGQQQNPLFNRIFSGGGANLVTNSTFTTAIANGEAGELADIISRQAVSGVRPGLITNAGLPVNFLRPNPDVRTAFFADNSSRSNFHAVQLEVRRRFRQGVSFQANYSFGKELSDFSGSAANDRTIVSLRRTDFEYGPQSPYHEFKANGIYELPIGRGGRFLNQGGVVGALLGGFQLGGIVRYESGQPLSLVAALGTLNRSGRSGRDAVSLASDATLEDVRSQVGVRRDPSGQILYFNPDFAANFVNPQPGTLGSLGRGAIEGPGYFTTDFSVIKRTAITENQNVEFRAEFFNVFNNVNFGLPSPSNTGNPPTLNVNGANFGVIDSTRGNPRIIQFALRYNF